MVTETDLSLLTSLFPFLNFFFFPLFLSIMSINGSDGPFGRYLLCVAIVKLLISFSFRLKP